VSAGLGAPNSTTVTRLGPSVRRHTVAPCFPYFAVGQLVASDVIRSHAIRDLSFYAWFNSTKGSGNVGIAGSKSQADVSVRGWNETIFDMCALIAFLPGLSRAGMPRVATRQSGGGRQDQSSDLVVRMSVRRVTPMSQEVQPEPHSKLALLHGGTGATCESCTAGQGHVESVVT